ncbi:unnamed protein product [Effrenium voratum]|uniref:Protein kinase domain-containing protein n=1 Tax=Effrenium voratum TaxID=2562239 RepID=A0AA36NKA1_9DINO|nr:unnamed protein product [Effrenium voratum]CAJ1441629.1 unnamed protein product [Effrenium voratum]
MCSVHVGHSPLTGFLSSFASPVMPRWPSRVSRQEDLYAKDMRTCNQRLRSRSRAKQVKDKVSFPTPRPAQREPKKEPAWYEPERRLSTEFLAKPWDNFRWLSKDMAATPAGCFARLVVPTKRDAQVWPLKEEELAERCLFNGWQGSVYDVDVGEDGRRRKSVMKLPPAARLCLKDSMDYTWPAPAMAADDQLWVCVPCADEPYFHLCNRALGSKVLEVRGDGPAASLRMCELNGSDHQKWHVDENSRLASKQGCLSSPEKKFCIDVISAQDANSASVCAYAANDGCNQKWQLEVVDKAVSGRRLVRIVSKMAGHRVLTLENGDQMRKDMILEICYLSRWHGHQGLVQLQKVIWSDGVPEAILLERLGKQLGKGTGNDNKACVLLDIRQGLAGYSPARAARSLQPVAQVLRRIHQDGFVYNDLHDGNILRRLDMDCYKVIDLGSVTRAEHWQAELGDDYGSRWSRNRDWRAFALAFLGLVLGRQLDVWRLVGTNNSIKSSGIECPWSAPQAQGVPADVKEMIAGRPWAPRVRGLLEALFAFRVDDLEVCRLCAHTA